MKTARRWFPGILFVLLGALHLAYPGFYLAMMPPSLPWPEALVQISGVCEIVGGLGLLVPRLRVAAAWGLIALLVAVFPANVYMAQHPEQFPGPAWVWYARLPLQVVFIALVYRLTRREKPDATEPQQSQTHAG